MRDRLLSSPRLQGDSATTTSSGTANVKGPWSAMVTIPFDCDALWLQAVMITASGQVLVDVGVGAAGQERVLVNNFMLEDSRTENEYHPLYLPLRLPANTRISARSQANNTTGRVRLLAAGVRGKVFAASGHQIDTYGADTSDSGGTQLTPTATANVFGSWVVLSSAIPRDISALSIVVGNQANASTTVATAWQVQLGVGSNNLLLTTDMTIRFTSSNVSLNYAPTHFGPFPIALPAGTQLSARTSTSAVGSPDKVDVVAYGLVYS